MVLNCKYKKARSLKEGEDEDMDAERKGVLTLNLNVPDMSAARALWPILLRDVEKAEQVAGPAPRGPTERWLGTQIRR